jgi:ribonuclease PH
MPDEKRVDGRTPLQLRDIGFEVGYQPQPHGSVLITWGETRVLCSATVEPRVPYFMQGKGCGWITAEYDMLPGSGNRRIRRDRGQVLKGRTQEIQRLIGRSLRQCVNLDRLGEKQITIDCDVLAADGGTRVASVTGGAVALRLAILRLLTDRVIQHDPWRCWVGGVSLGMTPNGVLLDLCYEEDSVADLDMNIVATADGRIIEMQATAEKEPAELQALTEMAEAARKAIMEEVVPLQMEAVGE